MVVSEHTCYGTSEVLGKMSFSPNPVFLDEGLDDPFEFLVEQESSHLISEETSSSIFDILPSTPTSQSFNTALLEDIDLDLQCEDDDVDETQNKSLDAFLNQTRQSAYSSHRKITKDECDKAILQAVSTENTQVISKEAKNERNFQTVHHNVGNNTEQTPMSPSNFGASDHLKLLAEPIICTLCSIQFSNHAALLAHNEDKHLHKKEITGHSCIICGVIFQNRKALSRHINKIHKSRQQSGDSMLKPKERATVYQCHLCFYRGKTKRLLLNHFKAKHNPTRAVLQCNQCDFTCMQERTLLLHAQRHDGDPKFACDQCGKLFTTMSILKRHAHTHNKIRAFACNVPGCDKTFNIKSRLTDHVRRVHKNQLKPLETDSSRDFHDTVTAMKGCPNSAVKSEFDNRERISNNIDALSLTEGSNNVCVYDVILPEDQIQKFNKTDQRNINFNSYLCSDHNVNVLRNHKSLSTEIMDGTTFSQVSATMNRQAADIHSHSQDNTVISHPTSTEILPQVAETLTFHTEATTHQKGHDKKFICGWEGCGKKFRDNYNLRLHMCIHTGETRRVCHLCRYRCVQKSAMDAHMKTHRKSVSDG